MWWVSVEFFALDVFIPCFGDFVAPGDDDVFDFLYIGEVCSCDGSAIVWILGVV